ncbi:type II toxin-antitoxin system RelE/ParE family toxin [Castellaniella hirudinis]|uniref:type II toxin-antitoxin system RelE/ParE family toxin n=1 Tax=Castellaniella hirudinis TaxID=1144617 RepID=UPI0039C18D74
MIVIWTPEAERDRVDIWDYIAADNPSAAIRMDELFSDAAARLAAHPKMGKAGQIAGTRELIPHESYRLVYEIDRGAVWVLALVHTARQWPPISAWAHGVIVCAHGLGRAGCGGGRLEWRMTDG